MSSANVLQFDWRSTDPSPTAVLQRLHKFFIHVGNTEEPRKSTQLVMSQSKKAFSCETVGDDGKPDPNGSRKLILRWNTPYFRGFETTRDKMYFAKWLLVLQAAVLRVSHRCNEAQEPFSYKSDFFKFHPKEAHEILLDLALSIGVSPAALGAPTKSSGLVSVPDNCEMKVRVAPSILRYVEAQHADKGREGVTWARSGHMGWKFGTIQAGVIEIEMNRPPSLVVVSEHCNIRQMMSELQEPGSRWVDILVLLTNGFADVPVSEFLSLLGRHPKMQEVPFLFISDNDFHAMQIYVNLKYGSKTSASTSNAQSCSKLTWAVPTAAALSNAIEEAAEDYLRDQMKANTGWNEETQEVEKSKFVEERHECVDWVLKKKKGCRVNKADKNFVKLWQTFGILEGEPEMKAAVDMMLNSGDGKFRLSLLAEAAHVQLERYLSNTVATTLGIEVEDLIRGGDLEAE